jgi:hypothetical protein
MVAEGTRAYVLLLYGSSIARLSEEVISFLFPTVLSGRKI